jgi:hypothetical protein
MSLDEFPLPISLQDLSLSEGILGDKINEISSKYFVDSTPRLLRRSSFDRRFVPEETADVDYLGEIFPFVNREQECIDLVRCFGDMDSMRGRGTFDKCKRDLKVPLCVGLPGIGKTRFARIAVTYLIEKATGVLSPTMNQMLAKSDEMAKTIWGDRSHDELLPELIHASQEDRNIRITLNLPEEILVERWS